MDSPIDSVAEIQAKYGAPFGMYTVGSFDARIFIFSVMTQCFERAKAEVNKRVAESEHRTGRGKNADSTGKSPVMARGIPSRSQNSDSRSQP